MRRWLTLDSRILSNTTQVLQGGQMREEGRAGSVCTATGLGGRVLSGWRQACLHPRARERALGDAASKKVYNFTAVEILTSILK